MAENKTKPTNMSPDDYVDSVANEKRREDAKQLLNIMREVTGVEPVMWGASLIGFGSYHYRYESGREGDALKVGFSPRSTALVVYGLIFYDENEPNNRLLEKLGTYKRGKGCLYLNSLSEIDELVLRQMIRNAFSHQSDAGS